MITTRCPHCKKNSPAFRKDGYTKMFVKPLAGRSKAAQDQKQRLSSEVESQTVASTKQASRKASTANEEDSAGASDDEEDLGEFEADDEIDEEFKEGGQ